MPDDGARHWPQFGLDEAGAEGEGGLIAIGCISPIILGVIGVLIGNWLDGSSGAIWGALAGLIGGGVILAAVGWLAAKLKQ
ncbi:MAG TPA: hypothetical protein VNX29_13675 [Kaistia sp.]|nr:hypothetical protein [Kaistia sp.]